MNILNHSIIRHICRYISIVLSISNCLDGFHGNVSKILFIYNDQRVVPLFENKIYSFASSGEYEERNEFFSDLIRFFKVDIIIFVFDKLPLSVPAMLVPHLISFFPLESHQLIGVFDKFYEVTRRCHQPEWIPIRICIL